MYPLSAVHETSFSEIHKKRTQLTSHGKTKNRFSRQIQDINHAFLRPHIFLNSNPPSPIRPTSDQRQSDL